jgi:hypothetical protein
VAGGVVAHVVREQNAAAYNDDSKCLAPGGLSRDQVCGSYRSTVDTTGVLAIVGYAAGGAALATSAYLFWRAAASAPVPSTSGATLPCSVVPWGVRCLVRF